ncbi:barstar family protein [Streptomyces sp. NPDC000594]|uniref:barstar family protein n=1 Tax=Streptomyces sp. NPDC000594 TaxID=3154261 RepID=UPI00331CB18F
MANSELVIDLRGRCIGTLEDFWDAVAEPCGLPDWFGRNLDAWADALESGGVAEILDRYDTLTVRVGRRGLFAGENAGGRALAEVFDGERHRLVVHPPADRA